MTTNIKVLAADLRTKLAAAVAADKKLIEAQSRAGLSAPQQIFTAADVKLMRADWYAEWRGMLPAVFREGFASATGQRTTSPFAKSAQLKQGADASTTTAEDIIRAGQIRRNENVVDLKRKK